MADLKTGLFPYLTYFTYLNRFRKSHQYDSNKADNISFELAGLPQATGTECSVKSLKIPWNIFPYWVISQKAKINENQNRVFKAKILRKSVAGR